MHWPECSNTGEHTSKLSVIQNVYILCDGTCFYIYIFIFMFEAHYFRTEIVFCTGLCCSNTPKRTIREGVQKKQDRNLSDDALD